MKTKFPFIQFSLLSVTVLITHLGFACLANLQTITSNNSFTITTNGIEMTIYTLNNGSCSTGGTFMNGVYMSTDNSITTTDELIYTFEVSSLAANGGSTTSNITIPMSSLEGLTDGTSYYLGFISDYNNTIVEMDENNNAFVYADGPHLTYTSVKNSEQSITAIYPNPADSELNIQFSKDHKYQTWQVVDNTGKVVLSGNIAAKKDFFQIEVALLTRGVYKLILFGENENRITSFIKE
jgi:Secretion system C-terminal sorting domain/CARDB